MTDEIAGSSVGNPSHPGFAVALARALRHPLRALFRYLYLLPLLVCWFARVSAGEPGGRVLLSSAHFEARAAIAPGDRNFAEAGVLFQTTRVSIASGLGSCVLKSWVLLGTADLTTYGYDKANNRTAKARQTYAASAWTTTTETYLYATPALGYNTNQLYGISQPNVAPLPADPATFRVRYYYDANGNRSFRMESNRWENYQYDALNRLTLLGIETNPDPAKRGSYGHYHTYIYRYDYRTRRVQRDEYQDVRTVTRLSFSGGSYVQTYTADTASSLATLPASELIRGNELGGGIGGLLYTVVAGAATHNLYNSRGDVISQSNSAGTATFQAQYEAFGTRRVEAGTAVGRQKANTKDEDPTGLLNEGFRYRDLETGSFITRDPMGFVDGPNVYTYVAQNPWTFVDPLGLKKDRDKNGKWDPNSKLYKVTKNSKDPEKPSIVEVSSRDIKRKNATIWMNGMNNDRDAAAQLGLNHTGKDEFYMVHNPSNGGAADLFGECTKNKLRLKTEVVNSATEILKEFDLNTAKITAHSQGAMILQQAMQKLDASGANMAGVAIQLDGSAAHISGKNGFGAELKSYGANMLTPRGSPFDAVHNIVGGNTKNPAKIIGSLLATPLLFANKNLSPHSTVEGGVLTQTVQNSYFRTDRLKRHMGAIHRR